MPRILLVAISYLICSAVAAQLLPLADVKAKGGTQLSAEDLKQLMPGAKVVNVTSAGSTRRWSNSSDGTLQASSDGRGFTGGRSLPSTGQGTWHVDGNGTYCVNIKWALQTEDWCSYLFKAGDKYYAARKLDDTAQASQFEISR